MSSNARYHLAMGHVEEPVVPRIYSCNRLGRQASPLSGGLALADWWRRATQRLAHR